MSKDLKEALNLFGTKDAKYYSENVGHTKEAIKDLITHMQYKLQLIEDEVESSTDLESLDLYYDSLGYSAQTLYEIINHMYTKKYEF